MRMVNPSIRRLRTVLTAGVAALLSGITLLRVLLLDLDQTSSRSTVIYRLVVDTAIGCAIAVTLGYLVWPRQHRTTADASALQPINIV